MTPRDGLTGRARHHAELTERQVDMLVDARWHDRRRAEAARNAARLAAWHIRRLLALASAGREVA